MIPKNSNVNPALLSPQIVFALMVADSIYRKYGQELVVTSLNDSKHSFKSLHYDGHAADLRTHYFTGADRIRVSDELRDALHDDYDVVLEKDHIHLEYDPK